MAAAKSVFFPSSFPPLTRPKDERTVIGRTPSSSLPLEDLVFAERRERGGELVLGGAGDEGQARVVRVSALVGGDLAVERREVRRVLRLGEQTPGDAGVEGDRVCEFVDELT